MLSPEHILIAVHERAAETLAEEKLRQAEAAEKEARWQAQAPLREQAYAQFQARLPSLAAQARTEHEARFTPLGRLLDLFKDPLTLLRDRYFPASRILVADDYYYSCTSDTRPKIYQRVAVIPDVRGMGEQAERRIFAIHAIATEPDQRQLIWWGPYRPVQYAVHADFYHYTGEMATNWGRVVDSFSSVQGDWQNVTADNQIFQIDMDETQPNGARVTFRSANGNPAPDFFSERWRRDWVRVRGTPEHLSPQTLTAISNRLVQLFAYEEIRTLR